MISKLEKNPITCLLFSDLSSINMASRRQFDFFMCFHPHNTLPGVATSYRYIVSQLCAIFIGGLGLASEANTVKTKTADMIEGAMA